MAVSTKRKKEIIDVRYINLEELLPNPYQPESRVRVDMETAKKFALSIQEHGLIQTPVVRLVLGEGKISQEQFANGRYEIADGWLRRAGFLINLHEFGLQEYAKMPCVVRELTDQQMADMVMEANTVRKDLNPIELATFYKRYLDDFKIPQAELARRHNCSQGEIANTIRLLDLPEDIQGRIISQEITETHGRQLLRLNYDAELQQEMVNNTVQNGGSVSKLSNDIAFKIYFRSQNIDPDDYPKAPFDTKECEGCPQRQKLGSPYSHETKKWRCVDKACYEKKSVEAEKKRVAEMRKAVAKAKAKAGTAKGEKGDAGVIDLSKLGWRDYQELDSYKKIDNPGECETCEHRALGKDHREQTRFVCVNVKCFQAKEKALSVKQAAETRKAEQELTQRIKEVCAKMTDEASMFKVITDHLLSHSRKDTRERFAKLYDITNLTEYFTPADQVFVLPRVAALVLQIERYEGEKGRFMRMLAELDGTSAELNKQIDAFREKHCKTCENGDDELGGCSMLMRVYLDPSCWRYHKKEEEPGEDTTNPLEQGEQSEHQAIMDNLPCKDCQNAPTCDRSFFSTDGDGGYICDRKVSAGAEEVPEAV